MVSLGVLLVDDNVLFRHGLADILEADGRFSVVGQVSRGEEAVSAARRLHPDLILMDLGMPGIGGAEAIRRIRADDPTVPIGVLTVFETAESADSAMAAGATGYFAKDSAPADLCDAAASIVLGPVAPTTAVRRSMATGSIEMVKRLTSREVEVLRALASAEKNAAIARRLGISVPTLRNHISRVYRKLQVYDRAQAVLVAVRAGLVEVPSAQALTD